MNTQLLSAASWRHDSKKIYIHKGVRERGFKLNKYVGKKWLCGWGEMINIFLISIVMTALNCNYHDDDVIYKRTREQKS